MTPLGLGLPGKSRLHLLRRRPCSVVADWISDPTTMLSYRQLNGRGPCRRMTSGATRGATAAMSRDVKRNLVELLFRDKKQNRIDSTSLERYTYDDLRKEYLKRLQVIHPDKVNARSNDLLRNESEGQNDSERVDPFRSKEDSKKEFQELQSTWDRYEELTKSMMKVVHGDGAAANFTKFGVGCSFSDNEEERALRTEITDQACRGWFSSGLVSSGSEDNQQEDGQRKVLNRKSLIDESLFVQDESSDAYETPCIASSRKTKTNTVRHQRRTLIPGIN